MLFVAEDATEISGLDPTLIYHRYSFTSLLMLLVVNCSFYERIKCCVFISDERSEGRWEEICPCHVSEEE